MSLYPTGSKIPDRYSVKDSSKLKDITNTKGNEKFTQSGDSLTWDT